MRCYSHLSDDEREQIGLAKAVGHSIGAIAKAIGRPKSTVSRELSRNKLPSGRYSPLHAAGAYQLRRRRKALIERDRALRTFVVDRLAVHHRQSHAQKMPGLQDPFPGDPQRAWQRRANPVRIVLLHLVLESRPAACDAC